MDEMYQVEASWLTTHYDNCPVGCLSDACDLCYTKIERLNKVAVEVRASSADAAITRALEAQGLRYADGDWYFDDRADCGEAGADVVFSDQPQARIVPEARLMERLGMHRLPLLEAF